VYDKSVFGANDRADKLMKQWRMCKRAAGRGKLPAVAMQSFWGLRLMAMIVSKDDCSNVD
jgi:hypothetical protein